MQSASLVAAAEVALARTAGMQPWSLRRVLTDAISSADNVPRLKPAGERADEQTVGSFTELMISFTFAADTSDEVLMAFAPWRTGDQLPPLRSIDDVVSDAEQEEIAYEVEMQLDDDDGEDLVAALAPRERAVAWRALFSWGDNAYFPGPAFTELSWDLDLGVWTLSARTVPKTSADVVQALVRPLGEYALQGTGGTPERVGVINDESDSSSIVILSHGRAPFQFD